MMNILTFELEEWFQIPEPSASLHISTWQQRESRIYDNADKMLRLLNESDVKATVFIPGWIAQNYPAIVRRVAASHSIGAQGMSHKPANLMRESDFRSELETSVKILQDISGKEVSAFRAPGFSITEAQGWAFEAMAGMGISIDSSMKKLPANSQARPFIIERGGIRVKEFPASRVSIKGKDFNFASGLCFRTIPTMILKKILEDNPDYNLIHISTRELDPGQPILKNLGIKNIAEYYMNLRLTLRRLAKVMGKVDFVDLLQAETEINWGEVPIVRL